MTDETGFVSEAVSSAVEKVFAAIGSKTYSRASEILSDHGVTFSTCYHHPEVLGLALREMFSNSYLLVVEKIRSELAGLEDPAGKIPPFLESLSG